MEALTRKFKVMQSIGKVLATVFWDQEDVLLVDFLESGATVNAAVYIAALKHLRSVILGFLQKVCCSSITTLAYTWLIQFRNSCNIFDGRFWTIRLIVPIWHQVIFIFFPALKDHLGGHRFQWWGCQNSIDTVGCHILWDRHQKLHVDKCLGHHDDYVEK